MKTKTEVKVLVGADVDGYAFDCYLGRSKNYGSLTEMTKALDFIFDVGRWCEIDRKLANLSGNRGTRTR